MVLFLSDAEFLTSGKVVKKQIGNPLKINPDGSMDLPSTPPTPAFTRSQPVASATGITPNVARFNFKAVQQKSNSNDLENREVELPESSPSMSRPAPATQTSKPAQSTFEQKKSKRRKIDFNQEKNMGLPIHATSSANMQVDETVLNFQNDQPDLDLQNDRYDFAFSVSTESK